MSHNYFQPVKVLTSASKKRSFITHAWSSVIGKGIIIALAVVVLGGSAYGIRAVVATYTAAHLSIDSIPLLAGFSKSHTETGAIVAGSSRSDAEPTKNNANGSTSSTPGSSGQSSGGTTENPGSTSPSTPSQNTNPSSPTTPTTPSTPTQGFQANCIVSPHVCGYPDATNTGVPAGTTLTDSNSVTVNTNGAVIQNLRIIDGQIVVRANNVTIKNVLISGCTYYPIEYDDSKYSGLVVQDTEIASNCSATTAGMSFGGYTAHRMNIHGTADGFKANANVTIQDSYIHDLYVTGSSHNDGVQSTGGTNVTLRHNTISLGTQGVCVQFGASDSGWLVTQNLFNCSGWMLNGETGTVNSTFTNNRFTRLNGAYGPASLPGSGITWTGNYYDNDNAAVNR